MTIKCKNCKEKFKPGKPWAKYCSVACGDAVRGARYYKSKKAKE